MSTKSKSSELDYDTSPKFKLKSGKLMIHLTQKGLDHSLSLILIYES